MVLMPAPIHST